MEKLRIASNVELPAWRMVPLCENMYDLMMFNDICELMGITGFVSTREEAERVHDRQLKMQESITEGEMPQAASITTRKEIRDYHRVLFERTS